ncbi:hypothetical protein GCM10010840_14950 [Deinococcus aerolatus]|uniref:Uncharacterized protein n=1 Tax=Deinococcus aerolatus TaxID=522487 RepID=A0ABQ2G6F3_9DEIO|nr:hypothetical protein GCM10010840_14950 [Deinococcus aerolatus]
MGMMSIYGSGEAQGGLDRSACVRSFQSRARRMGHRAGHVLIRQLGHQTVPGWWQGCQQQQNGGNAKQDRDKEKQAEHAESIPAQPAHANYELLHEG